MPDPPARIRSASVPCGVSSTSSSPDRYWRANSLFSPTYDATTRRRRPAPRSIPSPHSSTPALFDTTSRSRTPASSSARIRTVGMPHSPNPPTVSVAPSGMSATAAVADVTTLSIGPKSRPVRLRGQTADGGAGARTLVLQTTTAGRCLSTPAGRLLDRTSVRHHRLQHVHLGGGPGGTDRGQHPGDRGQHDVHRDLGAGDGDPRDALVL